MYLLLSLCLCLYLSLLLFFWSGQVRSCFLMTPIGFARFRFGLEGFESRTANMPEQSITKAGLKVLGQQKICIYSNKKKLSKVFGQSMESHLNTVFDTSWRDFEFIKSVGVARKVLEVGEQDATDQNFILQRCR